MTVKEAQTLDALLGWNEHLDGKNWLPFTDWPAFLRRSARTGEPSP